LHSGTLDKKKNNNRGLTSISSSRVAVGYVKN